MKCFTLALLAALLATISFEGRPEAEVIVRPEAAPGPLDNPLKGWCPYTNAGPIHQPYSMVFFYAPWSEIEPEEGRYAFDRWEAKAWSVPEAAGKHVLLRVFIDYPSKPSGLPGWLKAKGVKQTPYDDYGGGLSPDYDDPQMVAAMLRLIEAMGRRYDQNPRVAFLQLGLLGFWGEWHTYPKSKLYASPETERKVIAAFHRSFPNKLLMARTARGDAGRQPWIGFHDDLFPEDTDNGHDWSFLATIRTAGRAENWKKAVIGGEMVPAEAKKWVVDRHDQTREMIEKAHFSWVGPYCPALDGESRNPEFRRKSEALVRRMGYQFQLNEIRHPGSIAKNGNLVLKIQGENQGIAPFPYPWPVELGLFDEAGKLAKTIPLNCDVRTWLSGPFSFETNLKIEVPPGRYQIALGIRDPWTNGPAIAFANKLARREGWSVISGIEVKGR